ncbi:cyclic AMP-responsive element-binding protein 3-like protein 3 isoform X1 [Lissotriton helveticus]
MYTVSAQAADPRALAGMDSLELLDLLFDRQDGILCQEGLEVATSFASWVASGHNPAPSPENEEFLKSLLVPCDSSPESTLWSPAASDSGISEDPQSDQVDSPQQYVPMDSPSYGDVGQVEAMYQTYQEPCQPMSVLEGHRMGVRETDVSIDLAMWTPSFFQKEPQQLPLPPPAAGSCALTVKALLLSSSCEMSQQQASSIQSLGQGHCQELVLTEDEKKLLSKEGVSLPTQLPLTKYEERILKKIRRKIRNKQSAQESRKKKKEYIDGLESRMSACSSQNHELHRKVLHLEKQNTSLMEQLRKLQALIGYSANKVAQTSTCIAVLLLSFGLIIFPTISPFAKSKAAGDGDFLPVRVFSRSLNDDTASRIFHAPEVETDEVQKEAQMQRWTEYAGETWHSSLEGVRKYFSSRPLSSEDEADQTHINVTQAVLGSKGHPDLEGLSHDDPIAGRTVAPVTWKDPSKLVLESSDEQ